MSASKQLQHVWRLAAALSQQQTRVVAAAGASLPRISRGLHPVLSQQQQQQEANRLQCTGLQHSQCVSSTAVAHQQQQQQQLASVAAACGLRAMSWLSGTTASSCGSIFNKLSALQLSPQLSVFSSSVARGLHTTRSSSSSSSDDAVGDGDGSSSSGVSRGKDMAIVFTCTKCDTRAVKAFSRQSYEKGLVLVRCPGCQSLHLIADNLGWFESGGFKVDEYLASQGQTVKRVNLADAAAAAAGNEDGTQRMDSSQQPASGIEGTAQQQQQQQSLTAEDLAGWSNVQQLLSTVAAASAQRQGNQQEQPAGSGGSCSSSGGGDGGVGGESDGVEEAGGVVQVSPEDVQAWVRVQQKQQQQKE